MAFPRARGAVFQVQGPETTPFEVGGGEGGLFSLCGRLGRLELSEY